MSGGLTFGNLECIEVNEFNYLDPKDNSMATNQGLILNFKTGERAVFRLSGTGSQGATVRIYLESFEGDRNKQLRSSDLALADVTQAALLASQITEITGRKSPSVIT